MSNDDKDGFWDSYLFGYAASKYNPLGHALRRQQDELTGANKKPVFESSYDPSQPDGILEKIWDICVAGILLLFLWPFILAFHFIRAPFRKDLRWPKLTRIMAALSLPSFYAWNTSPSFHRIESEWGAIATFPLEILYLAFLIGGIVIIPATLVLGFFRAKPSAQQTAAQAAGE